MSVKGKLKEAAGFIKEEAGEKMDRNDIANKGRALRNEGRAENGKAPMITKPGTLED